MIEIFFFGVAVGAIVCAIVLPTIQNALDAVPDGTLPPDRDPHPRDAHGRFVKRRPF